MGSPLHINSEIGQLKTVLLHRPGEELLNLSPSNLGRMLFDDIPYLETAQSEHDAFARALKDEGVEVLYLENLLEESLASARAAKDFFVDSYIERSGILGELLQHAIREYLYSLSDKELISQCIRGISREELTIELGAEASLEDFTALRNSELDHLVVDPVPNLYFMRDPLSVIGSRVSVSSMSTHVRRRETTFIETIFSYHPTYLKVSCCHSGCASSSLEGGDVLVVSDSSLIIGVSERTSAHAIDELARTLLWEQESALDAIFAFVIPKSRAFMHLDTVFTQVDVDAFTVHPNILSHIEIYSLTRGSSSGEVVIEHVDEPFERALARASGLSSVRLIPCGGADPIAASREQWNDGANTLAIRPGRVVVYERNSVTNRILEDAGIELVQIPSAELSRGRGGPHCMSMALIREDVV